ncbi:MAG TPA: glycosyltransferase family 4 protein [Longimicrobium sp.]|nr:glycosyltransferase family 4 protein [Longimicrobium sp.]
MRVVQVGCTRDPRRRTGAALLRAWPTLPEVAGAAAAAGVDVAVVQAGWADETLEHDGVPIHFVAEPAMVPGRIADALPRRLLRAVRALRPDVIHLQGLDFPMQTRLLCATGVPVLVQDHGSVPPPRRSRPGRRWGLSRIAGVTFTAREQAAPFHHAGLLRAATPVFEVLESSTRLEPGDRAAARAAAGIDGAPCVLWIGRLMADKDPLTALDAFARAAERMPDARLWMAYGEAPLEAEVRARIASDARLRDRVHLLGRVPHARIPELCRAADVFLSASRREAAGFAVLEALACGLPVLAADIPALRRILRGGAVGGLVAPGDAAALAELLVEHAQRPADVARRAVRAHFDQHLSFDAVGRELRAAYEGVAR